jgi:hypothetical protein
MDDGKLRQILFQLQEQNKDLLNMVMNLQVSNNQLKQQLNVDFYKVYTELYNQKDTAEIKDFLESKQFIVGELNDIADKESNKAIEKFNENFEIMEENLENIIT